MTIYFARVGSDGPIKIGVTSTSVSDRLPHLQTGCPWPIRSIGEVEGDEWHESVLHEALSEHRMSGEWFEPSHAVIETIALVLARQFPWPDRPEYGGVFPPLALAISRFGSESGLARAVGCTQNAVWQAKRRGHVTAEMALAIDRATNGEVSKSALRPDLWTDCCCAKEHA